MSPLPLQSNYFFHELGICIESLSACCWHQVATRVFSTFLVNDRKAADCIVKYPMNLKGKNSDMQVLFWMQAFSLDHGGLLTHCGTSWNLRACVGFFLEDHIWTLQPLPFTTVRIKVKWTELCAHLPGRVTWEANECRKYFSTWLPMSILSVNCVTAANK